MQQKELKQGITEAVPIVLGYLPLGFAFGVLAKEAGMSVAQAVMMSVLCFTGAGQYIAIGIMQAGGAVITIILANILVNLRYLLFSTSTVPYLKDRVQPLVASLLSYGLTDETYAVAMNHYQDHPATASYLAGLNLTSHLGWIGSTLLGALLGSFITNTDRLGLGFALPAMYTCLLVLMINRRTDIWVAVFTAVTCLVIGYLVPAMMDNLSNLIIATVIAATLGVIINGQH
ncbi:MAG TPA: AzlC family ABC transporter permease [Syntrophaceticus sp.]|jgi:4-azaleucine resistance transporter AzlC|nr:AzlC family ABC transporter permease [Syntrophaceticus schinkii]MDD4261158.1 AzlC family ABC transporter permease [Syntrophaceticus schinkii]MDD4675448.1 AzlC family ABC transporter permease [Syntrophaceticus schinkii]HHY29903.1 AzlC family ABC transporter permease [Syntrophaceticus sp.]